MSKVHIFLPSGIRRQKIRLQEILQKDPPPIRRYVGDDFASIQLRIPVNRTPLPKVEQKAAHRKFSHVDDQRLPLSDHDIARVKIQMHALVSVGDLFEPIS